MLHYAVNTCSALAQDRERIQSAIRVPYSRLKDYLYLTNEFLTSFSNRSILDYFRQIRRLMSLSPSMSGWKCEQEEITSYR